MPPTEIAALKDCSLCLSRASVWGSRFTLTHQNLLFCRVSIHSILGFICVPPARDCECVLCGVASAGGNAGGSIGGMDVVAYV